MRLSRSAIGEERRIRLAMLGPGSCDFCGHEQVRIAFTLGRGDTTDFVVCPRCVTTSGRLRTGTAAPTKTKMAGRGTCQVCQVSLKPALYFRDSLSSKTFKPPVCEPCADDVMEVVRILLRQPHGTEAIDWVKPARLA